MIVFEERALHNRYRGEQEIERASTAVHEEIHPAGGERVCIGMCTRKSINLVVDRGSENPS